MKALRVVTRNIRDAVKSVFRNFSLSFASITCSSITLLLVTIAIILSVNVNYLTKQYEGELTITMYLLNDATSDDKLAIDEQLNHMANISEYKFISKDDWKKATQDESDIFNSALSFLSNNPLLDSYEIKVEEVSKMKTVANNLKSISKVESIDYNEGFVEKVTFIFDIVEKISIVLVAALLLVTAFLIGNTIKLTIFSRRTEIEIMRLVGTSNIVIKLPFIFEGFILGILGSLIPVIISLYSYLIVYDRTNGFIYGNVIEMVKPMPFILYLVLFVMAVGAIIGMVGSLRAVRKYLKI